MRAVNLIPSEAGGAARGVSAGPWIVLGVLGALLLGVAAYVLTNNTLVERRAQLASLQTQAQAAQSQADKMRPYREFAALAQARVDTVRQLGAARFDWHRAFAQLAQVIPDDVWLTSLLGTVTTGVSVQGASSGDTGSIRGALPNPAIELSGCTTGHDEVARLISRLRLMSGVVRVSLADSSKDEASGGGDCRYGHSRFPQFGLVVFFDALPAAPAPAPVQPDASATETPAASTTPAPSSGATASAAGASTGSAVR